MVRMAPIDTNRYQVLMRCSLPMLYVYANRRRSFPFVLICTNGLKVGLYASFVDEANPKPSGDIFAENHVDEPVQRKAEVDVCFSIELMSAIYSVTTKYLCIIYRKLQKTLFHWKGLIISLAIKRYAWLILPFLPPFLIYRAWHMGAHTYKMYDISLKLLNAIRIWFGISVRRENTETLLVYAKVLLLHILHCTTVHHQCLVVIMLTMFTPAFQRQSDLIYLVVRQEFMETHLGCHQVNLLDQSWGFLILTSVLIGALGTSQDSLVKPPYPSPETKTV